MPGIIAIQPKDIYVLLELSSDEVKKLHKVMGLIQINFDSEDKEEKEAEEYFVNKFYPFVEQLAEEIGQNAPNAK